MAFDKQIIQDAISEFMAEFAKDYTKAFAVAIVKQAIDGEEKHIEPDRRLRKFVPTAPVLQSVVLQSPDGGKKTKEAFWKINQQWNIEVWAKEADMTAGKKPKQTICPWDYSCWYWYPPTTFPRRRGGPKWEEGEDKPNCPGCEGNFTLLNRRAHCRTCGIVHCWNCTKKTWPLYTLGYTQPERVCTTCFKKLDTEGLDSFVFPPEDGKDDQFGVKLYHGYRNPVYFSVDSSELRSKWMDALYQCCRYAEAPRNPSLFQRAAFETAHRNAWYNKGPWWRWWKVFGTEEEMLSELLAFYVNRRCLTRVLESVKGPAAMRSKAEKPIEKAMAKMVEAAVSAGWPKTVEAVGKTESVVQPKVADALGPIGEAKGQLMDKLQEGIEQPIKSAIDAVGQPLLNAVVPIMFKPLIKALVGAPMILREAFKEVKTSNVSNYSDFQWRCRRTYFWWRVRDKITVPELEPMYDALRLLGKVPPFNFLNPWDIKYGISNACEELLDNFFYTLETEESVKAAIEGNVSVEAAMNDAWPALYDRFAYDAKKIAEETAMSILMKMLGFPIVKTVMEAPGVGSTLETLQNAIPGPLQEFFNIPECVEEVLTKAIAGVCSKIVDDNMKANFAHLEEGYQALSQQLA